MDALRISTIVAAVFWTTAARADGHVDAVFRWQPFIEEAAQRFALLPAWIERVMRAESDGLTELDGRSIRSRAGAIGLMQLMPATWADMRAANRLGSNPDDPHDNIVAGTAFLRLMYDRFGYPGMFAAYNAGPGRYADYLARRSVLPKETIAYLASVTRRGASTAIGADQPPRELLFALRHDLADGAPLPTDQPQQDRLFAIRKGAP